MMRLAKVLEKEADPQIPSSTKIGYEKILSSQVIFVLNYC